MAMKNSKMWEQTETQPQFEMLCLGVHSWNASPLATFKRGPWILVFKFISWLKKTEMELEGPNLGRKHPAG